MRKPRHSTRTRRQSRAAPENRISSWGGTTYSSPDSVTALTFDVVVRTRGPRAGFLIPALSTRSIRIREIPGQYPRGRSKSAVEVTGDFDFLVNRAGDDDSL